MTALQALAAWAVASVPLAIILGTWLRRAGGPPAQGPNGAARPQSPQLAHRS